jgi:hypothetical protein
MSRAIRRLAAATTIILAAGLGLTGATSPAGAALYYDEDCPGMDVPASTTTGGSAPTVISDTRHGVAGTVRTVDPLANDSDADNDKLYLVGTSSPARADLCVQSDGSIEVYLAYSPTDYEMSFTYGVTDGEFYRVGAVTFSVDGIAPMKAKVLQRLKYKKHTHRVKQPARLSYTNTNDRTLLVYGMTPKGKKLFQQYVRPDRTATFNVRKPRMTYIVLYANRATQDFVLVNFGRLNTRTGRQHVWNGTVFGRSTGEGSSSRTLPHASLQQWQQRLAD